MIEFLLNNDPVRLDRFRVDQTLLEYLREDCRRTGTKEGCASGDCGACTVVIARPNDAGRLDYRSVNSCITFLGSVHGCQIITVEDLATVDALHPVQQAMVDHHGSQCGFCTPGFVMSLFALYKKGARDRDDIETALAGNLCRCTGYRPIIDAGLAACLEPEADQFTTLEQEVAARLAGIPKATNMVDSDGGFHVPMDLESAAQLLMDHPGARPFCGATDLALEVTQNLKTLPRLIYLGCVPELNRIEVNDKWIVLGAAVRYSDCFDLLVKEYPDLEELLLRLGSVPIRNQGSVGGNVANASPIGDMPPVLIALGAFLNLRCGAAARRVPVEDFFLGYRQTVLEAGEFIESVDIPRAVDGARLFVCKNSKRTDDDISTVLGVFLLSIAGERITKASIAYGGMAAVPKRAGHTEAAMTGKMVAAVLTAGQAAIALDYQPIDDVRASAGYRIDVAQAMVERVLREAMNTGQVFRVTRYGHD